MTNVPLLCNICPRDPKFSDVSHLLTHVASKGHLSQHNKAKLRAHQDASLREKLETYDRWYQRHQIERLLSERMVAKDSKDSTNRVRASKISPRKKQTTGATGPRKARTRASRTSAQRHSPVKTEGPLDPQLSYSNQASEPFNDPDNSGSGYPLENRAHGQVQESPTMPVTTPQTNSPTYLSYSAYYGGHRAPIPHMSRWQDKASPLQYSLDGNLVQNTTDKALMYGEDTDAESDYFQNFLRSPTRTAYPDPCEITGPHSGFSIRSASSIKEDDPNDLNYSLAPKDGLTKGVGSMPQSPVLRGVKWPGMSLFDSANLEAQRLRNQKKTETIIEQMEHNSLLVEQMERIYWPDGSFKGERLITGEVESSPSREATPPPKPSRRRRAKASKTMLADLSTNAPAPGRKSRGRKASHYVAPTKSSDLRDISHRALASLGPQEYAYPRNAQFGYTPPGDEGPSERRLTAGLPTKSPRRGFHVFRDQKEMHADVKSHLPKTHGHTASQISHGPHRSFQITNSPRIKPRAVLHSRAAAQSSAWNSHLGNVSSKSRLPAIGNEDQENMVPLSDIERRDDDQASHVNNERITQRYFTVTGNQPPQFFSSMPPGMDFGGLLEPRYHGTTLNPLNTYFRQQQRGSPQALAAPLTHANCPSLAAASEDDDTKQSASSRLGGRTRSSDLRR